MSNKKDSCYFCNNSGKLPVDSWNTFTKAEYEPCRLCNVDDRHEFYKATEEERLNWFEK